MSQVLVVEDESAIAELMSINLRHAGYEVVIATTADEALAQVDRVLPDLVVLDWMLPGQSGLQLAKRWRSQARTRELPIIMLTARAEESDKISGLDAGADDYLTKPFSAAEFVARVKALLRRTAGATQKPAAVEADPPIRIGALRIDISRREVRVGDTVVELTAKEFDLLLHFARAPGRVSSRAQLLQQVWGYGHSGYEHTVNTHINRLRAKIERDPNQPEFIQTVWGVGYRCCEPSPEMN